MSRGQLTKQIKVVEWNTLQRTVRALAAQLDKLETEVEYLHQEMVVLKQTFLIPTGKKLGS